MKTSLPLFALLLPLWCHADDDLYATVYITKYALTRGIEQREARLLEDGKVAVADGKVYRHLEFWYSRKQAEERLELLKQRRLASIEKERKIILDGLQE